VVNCWNRGGIWSPTKRAASLEMWKRYFSKASRSVELLLRILCGFRLGLGSVTFSIIRPTISILSGCRAKQHAPPPFRFGFFIQTVKVQQRCSVFLYLKSWSALTVFRSISEANARWQFMHLCLLGKMISFDDCHHRIPHANILIRVCNLQI